MSQGKAQFTYYLFEGLLVGTTNGKLLMIPALSGGGGMSKLNITDSSIVNNPYSTHKKQGYRGKENAVPEKRGGPIPRGRYQINKPEPWLSSKKAVLTPLGATSTLMTSIDRGGFLIHGRGNYGSDGCIVPRDWDDFIQLMKDLEADDGGILWVEETMNGHRFT